MTDGKSNIIIIVLSVLILGLCYWYGQSRGSVFLSKGLVAYYPFNGNANNEFGNGNDGEVRGAVLVRDRHGDSDRAYKFAATSRQFIVMTGKEAAIPVGNAERTLSLWASTAGRAFHPGHSAAEWGRKSNSKRFGVFVRRTGRLAFISEGNDLDTNVNVDDSAWHHMVVSYGGGAVEVYLDGVLQRAGPKDLNTEGNDIYIGCGAAAREEFFNGTIDDVRIYNRALSESEVKELYEFEKVN
jgi:hypothetical protein